MEAGSAENATVVKAKTNKQQSTSARVGFGSPKLFLRPMVPEDVTESYLESFRDDKVLNFLEVDGKSLKKEDVVDYIKQGEETKSYYMYAICLEQTGEHIGNLKIGPINWNHLVSDLVCVIWKREYWGQGMAVKAINLGNTLAFEKYGIRKLHGQIYAGNIGSVKAYTRAGWIVEGIIRGRYLVDGKPMDQILVSCNNPAFFEQEHDAYNVGQLQDWQAFRKEAIGAV